MVAYVLIFAAVDQFNGSFLLSERLANGQHRQYVRRPQVKRGAVLLAARFSSNMSASSRTCDTDILPTVPSIFDVRALADNYNAAPISNLVSRGQIL